MTDTLPPNGEVRGYDVIVCGSGAAGMLAAVRLHDLGLRPAVIEKSSRFGGTSAISGGGLWIPCNGLAQEGDSHDDALTYLKAVSKGSYREDKLEAYLDSGAEMVRYLAALGVQMISVPGFPDYIADAPGATSGRSLFPTEIDGKHLGEEFFRLRDSPEGYKLFGRYVLNLEQSFNLSERGKGWQWTAFKLMAKYWLDIGWRRMTATDRRLTMGRALCGGLRKAMMDRDIPLYLNCALTGLATTSGRVSGVDAQIFGKAIHFDAPAGVILATGGFEQSQKLRDDHLPVTTRRGWSLTPAEMNVGDGLTCGEDIGADTETLDANWWAPSMQIPSRTEPNLDIAASMTFDHRHPFSMCVNGLGKRFVNESCSYDEFGQAMIADHKATGANIPCWLVFDAKFRQRYPCGPVLPAFVMPDRSLPPEWWGSYIFKAGTIASLAEQMRVPGDTLAETVERMNGFAKTGVDEDFGRGRNRFDRFFGKADVGPNPCFGPIDKPPFYAVRIDLGDLGSKGGLKIDRHARVMARDGNAITGLYAVGNNSGSPFGNCYPGAGGTLGPATVFAYIAAGHIAGTGG
ncbi:3-oxosteroid 1-dehydrogenase [Croceicoccus estronivorus]|uniref:FAD-binding protein n=1 Tax=Croceicoccus estronivorus TaxID=1172626 RepID=UPI000836BD9C|nr:FAD-binding protein [Croceicoccus estronivorus]OCC22893.1 3-oxosteroid 1-dehydrogenase [Croceicoccus estronivorus]